MTESEIQDKLEKIREITDRKICSITVEEAVRNCKIAKIELEMARKEYESEFKAILPW